MNLHYNIEVRDKDNNLYIDKDGKKVINRFMFEDNETNDNLIERICKGNYKAYNAITGSENINISVSSYNSISGSYMELYSYYGKESRFVKH